MPARRLIAPAAVLDFTEEAAEDPDFLVEVERRHRQAVGAGNAPRTA